MRRSNLQTASQRGSLAGARAPGEGAGEVAADAAFPNRAGPWGRPLKECRVSPLQQKSAPAFRGK